MPSDTFSNGAFTFFRTTSVCHPLTPAEIARLAQSHGLPAACIPVYAGDRAVVSRAIQATSTKVSKQGWLLRPLKQAKHAVSYGIVKEDKDREARNLDYHHEAGMFWCDEQGNGHAIEGDHWIAQEANATYQRLRGCIDKPDWTQTISTYIVETCQAQPLRDDGRVWWVATTQLAHVRQFQAFLQSVGIQLVLAEVESESVAVVRDAAQETLSEQLDALQAQVAAFDGEQKPSNYQARLQDIVKLKARAGAYKAALGIGVEHAEAILEQLERQVQGLLTVRQATVVHRNGQKTTACQYSTETAAIRIEEARTTLHAIPTLQPSIVTSWAHPTFTW